MTGADDSYEKSAEYWDGIDPTIDGMLGGFGKVSNRDLKDSGTFLKIIMKECDLSDGRALDCGAGIGRITKNLLSRHFNKTDLVERCPKFVSKAQEYLKGSPKIGKMYNVGLQDFVPEGKVYDVIWCQWVLGYLTDPDLIQFFIRCKSGLKPGGMIVVKENVTSVNEADDDESDGSVTRPEEAFKRIFQEAGLQLRKEMVQKNFPQNLYPIKMFALSPET